MAEQRDMRAHTEHAVLDIGEDVGALVIYTSAALKGQEIEVSRVGAEETKTHTAVLERRVNGRSICAALFLALQAGDYRIWCDDPTVPRTATIDGGAVAEVDWRASVMTRAATAHPHAHDAAFVVTPAMLPPRYRNGGPVCATPMGTAPMRYDAEGRVAWDTMWTDFCDLALAGGPPHRDTCLEPATPDAINAAPDAYGQVVAEITRGITLVTRLNATSTAPGWIGVVCDDTAMATWLMHAIRAENVAARSDGTMLFLPTGPAFRLEYEIKNVVTALAKTHHYWLEHRE